jgi:cell division protein ZipA
MDHLRLALIIAGVAVIVAVYLWEIVKRAAPRKKNRRIRQAYVPEHSPVSDVELTQEPETEQLAEELSVEIDSEDVLSEEDEQQLNDISKLIQDRQQAELDLPLPEVESLPDSMEDSAAAEKPRYEELIIINVSFQNNLIKGEDLHATAIEFGMELGDMDIYHYHGNTSGEDISFSMANMYKPGSFDKNTMPDEEFRGVAFFMPMGSQTNPLASYDFLVDIVSKLADRFNGVLQDDSHSILTKQGIVAQREKIQFKVAHTQ